jgi:hypothetical protein
MALEVSKYDLIYGKLLALNFTITHAKNLAKIIYKISEELNLGVNEVFKYVDVNGLKFENEIYEKLNIRRTNSSQIGILDQGSLAYNISSQLQTSFNTPPDPYWSITPPIIIVAPKRAAWNVNAKSITISPTTATWDTPA